MSEVLIHIGALVAFVVVAVVGWAILEVVSLADTVDRIERMLHDGEDSRMPTWEESRP